MKSLFRIMVCLLLLNVVVLLRAQERTIDEVKDEVYSFLTTDSIIISHGFRAPSVYHQLMQIERIKRDTTTYLYAVNMPDEGWAIVSNEKRYPAIIGYSTESFFDTDTTHQPGSLKLLLQHHMDMIDSLRESPSTFYTRVLSPSPLSHPLVDPSSGMDSVLLRDNQYMNRWSQDGNNDGSGAPLCDKVYNKFCPDFYNVSCGLTIVGCTAVAIAQILWYWHWPDYAFIKDHINMAGTPYGQSRKHYYDWDNMPPSITNSTPMYQVDQVAGLLRDCGYAAHMLYMGVGSMAGTGKLRRALVNTFNFHTQRYYEYAWTDIAPVLIEEIQLKRPVICQAWKSITNAHTFVIDGYSSQTNKFHVNFGWGWSENGTLNSMWDLGLYGYKYNRTFFVETYPDCTEREESVNGLDIDTIFENKDVTLYSANNVTINQLVVSAGGHLNISVGGSIVLTGGFNAQLGSHIKFATDYSCSMASGRAPVCAPARETMHNIDAPTISIFPNPARENISIQCGIPIEKVLLYNIQGQSVLETKRSVINISNLPQGIYIVNVILITGEKVQTKIIHE
ncbi:MAG: C10 family peptidase [Paludibacteraceae bacterium]|nr:C10 family peptidase [Paludibacteraceae bacterium]